jgi:chromosome segregation ATPase
MTPREALTQRIKLKRDHKDRLQAKLDAVQAEIASLVAQRDALTAEGESAMGALQDLQILRVEG